MTTHSIYMVDVFAAQPYAGNPLAVVVSEAPIPEARMQQLAAEINYSETTFVIATPAGNGGHLVRMFTPAREVAFAGHPILGTAWVIREYLSAGRPAQVVLNLSVGPVPVRFENAADGEEVAWFRAPDLALGATCERASVAAALGLDTDEVLADTPCQVVSAGTSALMVPVRNLDALGRGMLDLRVFAPLAASGVPPLVYLFCTQTRDPRNDFCARFFFEAHGVREDPAAGNGAAFLGAYLMTHRAIPGPGISVRIEQGYEVRRPSLVRMRARTVDGQREIEVGGRILPTVRGQLA